MKIAILHPDLGIGGAERLIVDVALALKSKEHEIRMFTSHHDASHCFPETTDGSFGTVVVGDWLPRTILGRCIALCAYFRMIYTALYLTFFCDFAPETVICDQISACIPVLKWKYRVIFYCHFPDQLLTQRKNWIKYLYRLPIDWIEEKTTGKADVILVNSNFTASVFRETFRSLKNASLNVLYPTINIAMLLRPLPNLELGIQTEATSIFLSINRYERKKNIALAVEAMDHLKKSLPPKEFLKIHLIIAGGYDHRVEENVSHYEELSTLVNDLELGNSVSFLKSPSDDMKRLLFHCCTSVVYTPENEHFGIVPLEAMLLGRPVIACNSGGPLETVLDGETGFLCSSSPDEFAEKMMLFVKDKSLARELGTAAGEHVRRNFSFQTFTEKLSKIVTEEYSPFTK